MAVADTVEEFGVLNKIASLQNDENDKIYKLAYEIIDQYLSDDGVENGALSPQTVAENFQFGAAKREQVVKEGAFFKIISKQLI